MDAWHAWWLTTENLESVPDSPVMGWTESVSESVSESESKSLTKAVYWLSVAVAVVVVVAVAVGFLALLLGCVTVLMDNLLPHTLEL